MQITAKDRELLSLLGENARMPLATIAKRLGLSRTTVQTRLERLEREGIIAGYGVRLTEDYLSTLVRAHILITIAPRSLVSVTEELAAIGEVEVLYSVNGPYDLIAVATAATLADLDRAVDRIGGVAGVERTLTSIILSTRLSR
jgi:DNA-binding Lrp family transcriptional regulator